MRSTGFCNDGEGLSGVVNVSELERRISIFEQRLKRRARSSVRQSTWLLAKLLKKEPFLQVVERDQAAKGSNPFEPVYM